MAFVHADAHEIMRIAIENSALLIKRDKVWGSRRTVNDISIALGVPLCPTPILCPINFVINGIPPLLAGDVVPDQQVHAESYVIDLRNLFVILVFAFGCNADRMRAGWNTAISISFGVRVVGEKNSGA